MCKMKDPTTVEKLETDIEELHNIMEKRGINSRGTADLFGRVFAVPVDKEHKATQDPLMVTCQTFATPHMRAFHTSWFGFFSSFFSTFAAAPLIAYIKPDLNLTTDDIKAANVASVGGTIFFRLMMGWICDKLGPRKGLGFLLLSTTPAIIGIMFVHSAGAFILCRCLIGFSLATFVACQVWCSQLFAKNVVGIANATAAGWGNLGGGVTNLLMPYVFLIFLSFTDDDNTAWRLCYLVPLAMHLVGGFAVLSGRDLPDGNYKELETSGAKQKADGWLVVKTGTTNVNAWILTITYGWCFGVELTMNNVAAFYYYSYQGLTPQIAGIVASLFGMMNLFARSLGGMLSDYCSRIWGMRGRLWACYIVQMLEGLFCIFLGLVTLQYNAPFDTPKVDGFYNVGEEPWRLPRLGYERGYVNVVQRCSNMTTTPLKDMMVHVCGTLSLKLDDGLKECLGVDQRTVLLTDPTPVQGGVGVNCIKDSNTIGVSVIIIIAFSVAVQMAEGLHFGIVPYVSRPALGIVSGMVGAGGNLGSVIALNLFFSKNMRTDEGILYLGIAIMAVTCLMVFIYFPDMGGMFVKAGALGSYDPQIIKPPSHYRGADSMDFANHQTSGTNKVKAEEEGANVSSA